MAEMGCGQSVTSGRGSWRGWEGGGKGATSFTEGGGPRGCREEVRDRCLRVAPEDAT